MPELPELGGIHLIIGLTGGIATGKSTVCKILKKLDIKVIDSDKIAHQVLNFDNVKKEIKEQFGETIIDNEGNINKKKLGKAVFDDDKLRKQLETITHPKIIELIDKKINKYQKDKEEIIVLDVPLLFETSLDKKVDETWVVYANKETQIKRLKKRDNFNRKDAIKRINAQMPLEDKVKKADVVIKNEDTIKELENKVHKLVEKRR